MLTEPNLAPHPETRGPQGWILLLCVLLIVWEPTALALRIAALIPTIGSRGPLDILVMVWRVVLMGIGMAAGVALWRRETAGVTLARAFLLLSAATAIVSFETGTELVSLPPIERRAMLTAILIYNAVWYAYLSRSQRVREAYGLGTSDQVRR